mmetsp:Transcript_29340/g.75328  ORF Transcript_29340/g.75328 Transcript_29340/m.75328 type:complete len:153 (+) Transcript_29340:244-702(+)
MYLRYGTGVWWTYDSFAEQVEAMMDCYEILFPEFQICSEVDHNHGHAKKKVGALCVTDMNLNWGGKKDPIRPGEGSWVTNDCVCSQPAMMTEIRPDGTVTHHDCRVYAGTVHHFPEPQPGAPPPPPPWYQPDAPPFDITGTNSKGEVVVTQP